MSDPLLRNNASTLLAEHRRLTEAAAASVEGGDLTGTTLDILRELWALGDEWEAEADRLAGHLADDPRESSGQWCELHGCHQDDPGHDYSYPDCERRLRDATPAEEAAHRRAKVAA